MHARLGLAALVFWLSVGAGARAGLYCSQEQWAELPSQWRGFLLDQRTLRNLAVPATSKGPANPARARYEQAVRQLEQARRSRRLTSEELADLGALYVRLGNADRAVEVLRAAQREHPHSFRIAANLGTAWQVRGDLGQAAAALQEAVRLAPGNSLKAEEYHLKLVRLRQRQGTDPEALDDLFGVRFEGEPGQDAAELRQRLPTDAVAIVQQLALWLPADARLLWQLAELANVYGDVKTAAALLDGCVTEFGLRSPRLRQRRQLARAAADAVAAKAGDQAAHNRHATYFQPRSKRPLLTALDAVPLPPVSATGVNTVPWSVFAETSVGRQFQPVFPAYLKELDGKQISITGYMQPLGDDLELTFFLLMEYPVGCWYCETPDVTGILAVELPEDKSTAFTRELVRVTGKLRLNATDPENFLFILRDANVAVAE